MELYRYFDSNTAEYVVLHAQYRAKRGKRPSCSFNGIDNPREALKAAKAELVNLELRLMRCAGLTCQTALRVLSALGFRLPSAEEIQQLLKVQENHEFNRVPNLWIDCDDDRHEVRLDWSSSPSDRWNRTSLFVRPR